MSEIIIQAQNLHKTYHLGKVDLHVLRGVNLQMKKGEFACIVGASGSGKSTLLHLVGLLDRPSKGSLFIDGQDASKLSAGRRNRIRCRDIGFVFQFYHLLRELNVMENVLLPAMVDSHILSWPGRRSAGRKKAAQVLDRLGLSDRLKHKPKELSGGERQRVAIARALMNQPKILLADEPTGNLDSKTGKHIMDLLRQTNRELGQTILMVTHDLALAQQADRVLHLRDGRMEDQKT